VDNAVEVEKRARSAKSDGQHDVSRIVSARIAVVIGRGEKKMRRAKKNMLNNRRNGRRQLVKSRLNRQR
jgi:hypothetical protein